MNKDLFVNILTADLIYKSGYDLARAYKFDWNGVSHSDFDVPGHTRHWQSDKSFYIVNQNLYIRSNARMYFKGFNTFGDFGITVSIDNE